MNDYQEQIKRAIVERIAFMRHLHQRDIKTVIDDIKNQYLWDSKIKLEDLKRLTVYLKSNWQELKNQAKRLRQRNGLSGFTSYQV